jgi:hypothetical protein
VTRNPQGSSVVKPNPQRWLDGQANLVAHLMFWSNLSHQNTIKVSVTAWESLAQRNVCHIHSRLDASGHK